MADSANEADDPSQADIGIVCALPLELGEFFSRCERVRKYSGNGFTFRGGLYDGIRIVAVEAGTGMPRASRATHALIDAHHPPWIISCGFAGGLQPELKRGHLVVAERLLSGELPEIRIDLHMPSDPAQGLHVGTLVTADAIVRTAAEKQALGERYQALAVDMETYGVAAVCRERHQKFLAIRVLTDDVKTDLPPEVLSLLGATGTVRFGAVVASLWKRPSSANDMWQMREDAQIAAKRLADFLDGVVSQLHRAK